MKLTSIWLFGRSQAPFTGATTETDTRGTDVVPRETAACARRAIVPTGVHARQFLQHLLGCGYQGQELLVCELQPLYAQMCTNLVWQPRPWLSIAPELRRLTTGAKKLKRLPVNGMVRRLRVYPIIPRDEPATAVVGRRHGVTLRSAA